MRLSCICPFPLSFTFHGIFSILKQIRQIGGNHAYYEKPDSTNTKRGGGNWQMCRTDLQPPSAAPLPAFPNIAHETHFYLPICPDCIISMDIYKYLGREKARVPENISIILCQKVFLHSCQISGRKMQRNHSHNMPDCMASRCKPLLQPGRNLENRPCLLPVGILPVPPGQHLDLPQKNPQGLLRLETAGSLAYAMILGRTNGHKNSQSASVGPGVVVASGCGV